MRIEYRIFVISLTSPLNYFSVCDRHAAQDLDSQVSTLLCVVLITVTLLVALYACNILAKFAVFSSFAVATVINVIKPATAYIGLISLFVRLLLLLLLKDLYSALGRIKHESERCDGAEPS